MKTRKILILTIVTALTLPIVSLAKDYRAEKPATWTAHSVDDAVKALYGDVQLIKSDDVILKMPKITSSGGAVPVKIQSNIEAKSVSLFQNSNPESAVAVWKVFEGGIIDYNVKLKIKTFLDKSPSTVTVVVEGKDGKFYSANASVKVAGGCE